jgi:hypothetical protein
MLITQILHLEVLKGKAKTMFSTKCRKTLGHGVIGTGHAVHIFHSTVLAATNILPADVEMIVSKICLYFISYTIRVQTLKEFCDFVEREFEIRLGYAQTRWLALLPATERVFKLFLPLKSYFQSQDT